jgi:hypothetical protein
MGLQSSNTNTGDRFYNILLRFVDSIGMAYSNFKTFKICEKFKEKVGKFRRE